MVDLVTRPSHLRKNEWGMLAVLAGSERYPGAAVLTVQGAKRTGIDKCFYIGPERAADAVLYASPSSPNMPLSGPNYTMEHLHDFPHVADYTWAIGPGLTTDKDVLGFFRQALSDSTGPLVIDADGLRLLKEVGAEAIKDRLTVLTPNWKEFTVLTGQSDITAETVSAAAEEWDAVILAKGEVDIISDGDQVFRVEGGSSYLAKDGSGDVLTGVVGALLSRGLEPLEAAQYGAMLLKEAGERAAAELGPGMVASDLPDYIDPRRLTE